MSSLLTGIWLNTSSEKEQNHKKKHNKVIFDFFHKNEDNDFALICLTYLRMHIIRLAEIIAAIEEVPEVWHPQMHILSLGGATWSAGFWSVLYSSITLVASQQLCNRWWHQKRRVMAFFELPFWNITTT